MYPATAILPVWSAVYSEIARGKTVIGMGENKTPEPFRKACDKFTILENLMDEQEPGAGKARVQHERLSIGKIEDAGDRYDH